MICDVIQRGDLEAYVFGEAAPDTARKVESHLFGCAECAAEMRLLRSERRVFRARQEAVAAEVPSFEALLSRLDAEVEPAPVVSQAKSPGERPSVALAPRVSKPAARASRGSFAVAALVAAAAVVTLLVRGRPVSPEDGGERAGAPEIAAEEICGSGDEVVWMPVSREPIASYDPAFAARAHEPIARGEPEKAACAGDVHEECDSGESSFTSACEDAAALCGPGRQ